MAEKKPAAAKKPPAKAEPDTLVSLASARVATKEGTFRIRLGQAYPSDHPVVEAQPHLFGTAKAYEEHVRSGKRLRIERATAAPGEKRGD